MAESLLADIKQFENMYTDNSSVEHGHKDRIETIAFSPNSMYFVTVSREMCKPWTFRAMKAQSSVTIFNSDDSPPNSNARPMACIDNQGKILAVYRGNLHLNVYDIPDKSNFSKRETVDVAKLIQAQVNQGFKVGEFDTVSDVRFICKNEAAGDNL